jgi:hypothetical protein
VVAGVVRKVARELKQLQETYQRVLDTKEKRLKELDSPELRLLKAVSAGLGD